MKLTDRIRALAGSLATRVFLILIAGVLLSALVTLDLAFGERQRMIGEFREIHAVERLAQYVLALENVPAQARAPMLAAAAGIGMRAEPAGPADPVAGRPSRLAELLGQRLTDGHKVESAPARAGDCPAVDARGDRARPEGRPPCESLLVTLPDGSRLRLTALPPRPLRLPPRPDFFTYGLLFLLSVGVLAALVARMTMRPLQRLAQAAAGLGQDIERPPLPERGATEIRQAAIAFNAMQARVREHIRQRAHILAAITHDLQTPLTRLRLRLEKVDDAELRDKLLGDLSAMQGMVREGLDLARSMDSTEPVQRLDLDSLVDSVCADALDAGQQVKAEGQTGASLLARPIALRRCLTNLIDNAVKYGNAAQVSVSREDGWSRIVVRDQGPGIPADELAKVFEPFYRLEGSRSRDTGGTGLGLTIARNIAEQHGGSITLRNLPAGGLEAELRLPLPSAGK